MTYCITTTKEIKELKVGQVLWIKQLNGYSNKEWKKVVLTSNRERFPRSIYFADYETTARSCMSFREPNYDGSFLIEDFFDPETSLRSTIKIIPTREITDGSDKRTQKKSSIVAGERDLKELSKLGKLMVKFRICTINRYPSQNSLKDYEYEQKMNFWNPLALLFLFFATIIAVLSQGFSNFDFDDFMDGVKGNPYQPYNIEIIKIKWRDIF